MKSWKTTAAGISGILGLLATALAAQLDNDPATVANWGVVIPAIITSAGLLFARDANVTSEQQGAK
jgi:hypothetical protein